MLKKLALVPMIALVFSFISITSSVYADTGTSTSTNKVEVDVMTHLCNPSIKNEADFQALTNGKTVLGGFANQVLNCPTTVLPSDAPVPGTVASPQTPYEFTVLGEHYSPQILKNSDFHSEKLCESDINEDVNADGKISSSTCLDTSEYHFNNLFADNGKIDVIESKAPQGYHFGTLLFTPPVIDGNNDQQSLLGIDHAQGRIQLDTTNDKDKIITLHVYNFVNDDNPLGLVNGMPIGSSTGTGTSTSGNTGSGMSSTTTMTTGTTTSGTATTTNSSIISQIQTLEQQIQNLETQLANLLHQLM